jgi:hypothetical protein
MKLYQTLLFVLAGLSLMISTSSAQVRTTSLDDLATASDVVAEGQVSSLQSEWNENHSAIRTKITIDVSQYYKGNTTSRNLIVSIPGGEVDGVGELYTHFPNFKRNENIILFARKSGASEFHVTGGVQGKVNIDTDPATGMKYVNGTVPFERYKSVLQHAISTQSQSLQGSSEK